MGGNKSLRSCLSNFFPDPTQASCWLPLLPQLASQFLCSSFSCLSFPFHRSLLPSPTNSPRSCFDSSVIIVTKEGNSLPAPSERKRAMRTTRASISPRPSVHARSPLSGFRCRRRGENAPRQRDYGTAAAPLLLRRRRQPCGRARPPCNLPTNLGGRTYLHTSNVSIPFWV